MAHKMVIHAGNYGKGSVGALEHHNLRENETYSNKDINPERTKDNVTLKTPVDSQYRDTKRIIEQRAVNQVRKNSIWQSEFIISSDKEFFSDLPLQEQNRFFEEAYKYLSKEFGEQNVTCVVVHYDETTPHMHFDFVPMTEENKLSRKEVMTRDRLIKIQDELPKYLHEKGYEVVRGRKMVELAPEERPKHLEPGEYKKALQGEIRALERQKKEISDQVKAYNQKVEKLKKAEPALEELDKRVSDKLTSVKRKEIVADQIVKNLEDLPKGVKTKSGHIALQEEEYKKLTNTAKHAIIKISEYQLKLKESDEKCDELKQKIPTVKERLEIGQIKADYKNMENRVERLERQNERMKDVLEKLKGMDLPDTARKLVENALDTFKRFLQKETEQTK